MQRLAQPSTSTQGQRDESSTNVRQFLPNYVTESSIWKQIIPKAKFADLCTTRPRCLFGSISAPEKQIKVSVQSMALDGERLYVGGMDGNLRVFNVRSFDRVWNTKLEFGEGETNISKLVAFEDCIFAISYKCAVQCIPRINTFEQTTFRFKNKIMNIFYHELFYIVIDCKGNTCTIPKRQTSDCQIREYPLACLGEINYCESLEDSDERIIIFVTSHREYAFISFTKQSFVFEVLKKGIFSRNNFNLEVGICLNFLIYAAHCSESVDKRKAFRYKSLKKLDKKGKKTTIMRGALLFFEVCKSYVIIVRDDEFLELFRLDSEYGVFQRTHLISLNDRDPHEMMSEEAFIPNCFAYTKKRLVIGSRAGDFKVIDIKIDMVDTPYLCNQCLNSRQFPFSDFFDCYYMCCHELPNRGYTEKYFAIKRVRQEEENNRRERERLRQEEERENEPETYETIVRSTYMSPNLQ